MGIYDRDYNRAGRSEQEYSGGSMMGTLTPAVKWLLIINFVVFVIDAIVLPKVIYGGGQFKLLEFYGSILPDNHQHALQLWRLITYQFLHGDVFHLVFNMLALYIFGPFLEGAWGSRAFIKFYLICGAAGGILYSLLVLAGVMPAGMMVGASGAIYGVTAAVAYLFPRQRILVMGIIPMTMRWLVVLFIISSFLGLVRGENVGGELGHLTGLGAGFVYVLYKPWVTNLRMHRQKGAWSEKVDKEREFLKEVDEILDKVHREGMQSLTWHERHVLQEATRREQQNAQR